ncbi:MAG: ribonuclease T [Pseudomonadota bacterium]
MSGQTETPTLMQQRFRGFLPVVVDVETGGFNASTDALLEIATVLLEMDEDGWLYPGESIQYNVQPFEGANIEKAALQFTGIEPGNPLRDERPELEAMRGTLQTIRQAVRRNQCKRAVLVGHNATFDLGFVKTAADRQNIKRNPFHPFSTFDTAALAGLALGHTVLAESCRLAGIEFDNKEAHSALYDAEKTAELFCLIVNRWKSLGGWPPPSHGDA